MLGAHSDITAFKKAEQELRAALQSNYELEQFAYVASHDLREPLRLVVAYLDLLTKHSAARLDPKATGYIRVATECATRLQALIDGLLRYARIGARQNLYAATDASELLRRALADLSVLIEESGARVSFDPLPTVEVDPPQIEQVFQNLISNAIKFRGSDSPRVHVRAERDQGYWVFHVEDNGVGIHPDAHERVFQMFQRLHRSDEYAGNGIGLAISKRIVQRHGGRIWVESRVGSGSCFTFTLPALKTLRPRAASDAALPDTR
jgi:light-regulated signal transduction histidine kinase (bacteriophytochrome)